MGAFGRIKRALTNESVTPGAASDVDFIVPHFELTANRITVWVRPDSEDVTVAIRTRILGADGTVRDGPVLGLGGSTAPAGTWWVFTTEDIQAGEMVVRVTTGGSPPGRIDVVTMSQY